MHGNFSIIIATSCKTDGLMSVIDFNLSCTVDNRCVIVGHSVASIIHCNEKIWINLKKNEKNHTSYLGLGHHEMDLLWKQFRCYTDSSENIQFVSKCTFFFIDVNFNSIPFYHSVFDMFGWCIRKRYCIHKIGHAIGDFRWQSLRQNWLIWFDAKRSAPVSCEISVVYFFMLFTSTFEIFSCWSNFSSGWNWEIP